ncbi:ribbon-helix-helix domain-containing protein [Novacetimonas hansenii]|uniref:Ribbon-helix-helix domain-containing protein n=3 Tax=Novacetimonas hansenii TaxID=436 RepID=A0AAW5EU48_NOVHA|nr:ribbon-helix-helix domain-containing protein [Novacetimonas hansenii]MCJ8353845.1 ribbon-helix-helix domain-containing protein [Novacetimonas hansenii]WEQ57919.1 ribbon-helix-helix domain-containing protein [Novacetimonas hansenii]CUW46168.1 hypothetical protein ATCC53582_00254 [Novacetimonas hansenii]
MRGMRPVAPSPLLHKRSMMLSGHRTSVALEPEFWGALERMARARGVGLTILIARIDTTRDPMRTLASALRVAALLEWMPALPAAGGQGGEEQLG